MIKLGGENMRQNKSVILVFLALLFVMPMHGQWNIGGLIDINLSSISVPTGSSSADYSSRLGFGIGAVVDRQLTDRIDLHAEPMFLQKGARIETSNFVGVFKINYFEIPLMFRYNFEYNESLLPYAMAGPSIGFLTNAKLDVKDGGEQDENENTKGFDFGAGIGGGVKHPRGNMTFFAEIRYVLGLMDINKEADESKVKNRGLQVVAGVTVPLNLN